MYFFLVLLMSKILIFSFLFCIIFSDAFFQHFIRKIFVHGEKLEEFYSEESCISCLDSIIDTLQNTLYYIYVLSSIFNRFYFTDAFPSHFQTPARLPMSSSTYTGLTRIQYLLPFTVIKKINNHLNMQILIP